MIVIALYLFTALPKFAGSQCNSPPDTPDESTGLQPPWKNLTIKKGGSYTYKCKGLFHETSVPVQAVCTDTSYSPIDFSSKKCHCVKTSNDCKDIEVKRKINNEMELNIVADWLSTKSHWSFKLILSNVNYTVSGQNLHIVRTYKRSTNALAVSPKAGFSGGLLQLKFIVKNAQYEWMYPCILKISCQKGPDPPVTTLIGSLIIISAAAVVLLLLSFFICCCCAVAKRNDANKKREDVGQSEKGMVKVGEVIVAKGQQCKINFMEMQRRNQLDELNDDLEIRDYSQLFRSKTQYDVYDVSLSSDSNMQKLRQLDSAVERKRRNSAEMADRHQRRNYRYGENQNYNKYGDRKQRSKRQGQNQVDIQDDKDDDIMSTEDDIAISIKSLHIRQSTRTIESIDLGGTLLRPESPMVAGSVLSRRCWSRSEESEDGRPPEEEPEPRPDSWSSCNGSMDALVRA